MGSDGEDELTRLRRESAALKEALQSRDETIARLRGLVDRAADAVVLHDGQGQILDANQAAWEHFGRTREEYVGHNVREFDPALQKIPKERWGRGWAEMRVGAVVEVQTEMFHANGELIPVEGLIAPFLEGDHKLFVASFRDARERRKLEEQRARMLETLEKEVAERTAQLRETVASLEQARDEANAANLAKSQFLANMSHELRTPLNAVIGYTELLVEEVEEDGGGERSQMLTDLHRIRGAAKHLLGLIDDVLDLSKVEAGKLDLQLEDVALPALIEEIAATVAPLAAKNGNTIEVVGATELTTMHTDATRLRQILLNLLSNACKFTEGGTISLIVRARRISGQPWVLLQVRDTGVGIAPSQIDGLFKPFTQADASTTRRYGGTGLGLAITDRLCVLLGGRVEAASTPGEGSTFSVVLPATADARAAALRAGA